MQVSWNTDSSKPAKSRDTQAVDTYLSATKSTPVYNTGGSGGIEFKSSWISSTRIEEFGDSWR